MHGVVEVGLPESTVAESFGTTTPRASAAVGIPVCCWLATSSSRSIQYPHLKEHIAPDARDDLFSALGDL